MNEFGDIPNGTPGLKYSRKKISSFAQERFSVENMAYTQRFIDYLHAKNPYNLQWLTTVTSKPNSHSKLQIAHIKFKSLTANSNCSRQIQIAHSELQITHSKLQIAHSKYSNRPQQIQIVHSKLKSLTAN